MGAATAAGYGPFWSLLAFAVVDLLGFVGGWSNILVSASHHLDRILSFHPPFQPKTISWCPFFIALAIRMVSRSW